MRSHGIAVETSLPRAADNLGSYSIRIHPYTARGCLGMVCATGAYLLLKSPRTCMAYFSETRRTIEDLVRSLRASRKGLHRVAFLARRSVQSSPYCCNALPSPSTAGTRTPELRLSTINVTASAVFAVSKFFLLSEQCLLGDKLGVLHVGHDRFVCALRLMAGMIQLKSIFNRCVLSQESWLCLRPQVT
jgi:hypothetical protein